MITLSAYGIAYRIFITTPALVTEARVWLIDCNMRPCNTPEAIALQIRTYYEGGIKQFVDNSRELIDSDALMSI